MKNTHASTHNLYKLRIEQIFKISRHGEGERFRQFSSLDNRTLLWHGSRTTNFAGILSQVPFFRFFEGIRKVKCFSSYQYLQDVVHNMLLSMKGAIDQVVFWIILTSQSRILK